ncbi:MAG: type II toxin-antitoxin system Phd/YefM family antitoxin [Elusimicrobiota bacterium]
MNRPHLDQDIRSLSEFRARVASFVQQVHQTHRPVVITHHGKSAAVLLDVSDYESLLDKLELIQDVRDAEKQIDGGEGLGHKTARRQLLSRLSK